MEPSVAGTAVCGVTGVLRADRITATSAQFNLQVTHVTAAYLRSAL